MSSESLFAQPQFPPWNAVDWEADRAWEWTSATGDAPEQLYRQWQEAVNRSRETFSTALATGARTLEEPQDPYPARATSCSP